MKEIGKEIVEIGGVEYTLFLNRKGIIAWEKYAQKEADIVTKMHEELKSVSLEEEKIEENTNPFEGLDVLDNIEEKKAATTAYYQKLYWIMLYENHKFSLEKAKEIYNEACKEYGEEQIIQLGNQMIEDANKDLIQEQEQNELKKLKALRPTK